MDQIFDLPEVTADDCYHEQHCGECNLYAWCEDRLPIAECKKCGTYHVEDDLSSGLCKDCLAEYVDPQTVKEYAEDLVSKHTEYVWESLFEEYFSEPDDRCQIERVSETLKDRLMKQIMLEFNWDKLGDTFHSKARLMAWVGEDEVAWGDFADWLVEKKGVLKTC